MRSYKRKADCTPEEWEHQKAGLDRKVAARLARDPDWQARKDSKKAEAIRADPARMALAQARWARARDKRKLRQPRTAAEAMAALRRAVPGTGPDREDILAEAFLALMEGRAKDVPGAIALGRKAHWRLFSRFATLSLDEPIGDGSLRRIDLLAAPDLNLEL